MTLLAPSLQSYFTDHAHARKGLSPNTIAAYRDTWRLLIKHLTATTGVPADKIDLGMLDAAAITAFLDHLQDVRGNSAVTRNARLTAIRALLAVALPDHPEHADTIGRVLALPARRRTPRTVHFLTLEETEALLAAPDTKTFTGRRDQALLTLAAQTGLRISELHRADHQRPPHRHRPTCDLHRQRTPVPSDPADRRDPGRPAPLPARARHPPRRRGLSRATRAAPLP